MEKGVLSSVTRLSWLAFLIVAALALVVGGYWYYRFETERIRTEKYQEISAIAKLKAGQIKQWRQERLSDISRSSKAPFFGQAIREWLRDTNNISLQAKLQDRLVLEQKEEGYADVLLLDTEGRVLLSAEPQPHPLSPPMKKAVEEALANRTPMLSDLYRCPEGIVHVDAVGPILDVEGQPVAVLVLRSNAESYLYPLIQSWPTPSRTAETVLVRKEGQEVLFLNDLRHHPKSALSLREPLTRHDLPAVQAVLGKQGMFQGRDYRGVEVLADLRRIPETPWFMVTKEDTKEILAEAHYRAWIAAVLTLLLIMHAAGVTAYAYRYRQVRLYRDLYQSERERRDAHEEFRTTLYSIGDAVISTDTGGLVKQMNPVAERLTGWLESEACGKPLDEVFRIVNEDSRSSAENPAQRVLREGRVLGLANHTLLIARDGAEFPIMDSGAPIRDESGSITGVVLVFRDQTKEREAEKERSESERRYRDLWEKAPVMMISLDTNGRILFASDHFCDELGYGRDELLGRTPFEFQTEQSCRYAESVVFPSFLQTGSIKNAPLEFVKKNGEVIDVLLNVTAERDAQGNIVRSRSVFMDISDRKRTESALRKSEVLYRTLFESAGDAIYVLDTEDEGRGRIVSANPAAADMHGYTEEELLKLRISDLDSSESAVGVPMRIQRILQGETVREEVVHRRKDGTEFPLEINARLMDLGDHKYILAIDRDITERTKAEQATQESEKRYRSLFENMLEGYAYCRVLYQNGEPQDFAYLDVNEAFGNLTGLKNVIGKKVTEVIPGIRESNPELFKIFGRAAQTGNPEKLETYVEPLGIWFSISVYSTETDYFVAVFDNITERKRAEEALRESEERLRLFIEHAPTALAMFDRKMRYLAVSRRWMNDYRLGERDIIGRSHYDIFPEIPDRWKAVHQRGLGGEIVTADDDCFERADSTSQWLRWEVRPWYAADGGIGGIVIFTEDISDRKRAQQALRDSEERFRILAEGAFEGVVISRDGVILDSNKVFCDLSGYSLDELTGMNIEDLVAVEFKKVAKQRVLAGSEEAYESAFVTKNGDVIPTQVKGKTIPYEGGLARIASVRDISAARKAEEAQKLLATAIEQSAEAVLITDTDGVIQYVNPAVGRITGFSSEELLGKTPRVFKSDEHDTAFYRQLWSTIKAGNIWSGRFVNKRKDGNLLQEDATISPVRNAAGVITNFVAVKRDVTEHLQLSNQLLQAQKMEAVGTLAGGVAHDFNNILQVVLGYSDLILADELFPRRFRPDLEKVNQAARNGADLVGRLLMFSRKSEIKPLFINLNRRIEQLQKMLSRTIPKMIEIELVLADDLSSVHADPTQVDQILMNLAVNARDAMSEGGRLTIQTENVTLDEEYAKTHLEAKPGRYVLLSVSDTGQGMDKETVQHIFEPFFTTKGPGEGTGLGLAMVYGIVKQHGGHIMCYSEPGKGTAFRMYFPALVSDEESLETETRTFPRGGSETILLVDDEELIRDLGARILTKAGYKVITASNGKEALELYQARSDEISLVILDLIMPEMGGKQCLEGLLEIDLQVKVLIASGYSAAGRTKETVEAGAKGFVNKPYNIRLMLQAVRDALDSD